jgi:CBS domain-containing protein
LRSLGVKPAPVVSVHSEAYVLEAMSKMSELGLSSVAIVDGNGVLIGNISMTDIKVMNLMVYYL